jgi:uncharacterized protein (DUF1501 family)
MVPLLRNDAVSRRALLGCGFSGVFAAALASLLAEEGLLGREPAEGKGDADPLAPKAGHFPAKAKQCIFFFMWGGPSQIDLFNAKPELNRRNGQPLPDSLLKNAQFAFVQKETARLKGSPFKFAKYGQSGIEFSELLPNLGRRADDLAMIYTLKSEQFNHRPGQIMMHTGFFRPGRPTLGSWLLYGLGSQCHNLPGYVAMNSGTALDGGPSNWTSGFLPSTYAGTELRGRGAPILDVSAPDGLSLAAQRRSLQAVNELNQQRYHDTGDSEILSRIANYELAFRMQSAAPELCDLGQESDRTRAAYGLDRNEPQQHSFARNCLLARRLVERGVRFVAVYCGNWDAHFNVVSNHSRLAKVVDQPLAALLDDLKQRGLLETTLVVWASEFGRTPVGENRPQSTETSGRDHHPNAFTVWLAGGGVKGGRTIGKTDEFGWNALDDSIPVQDFHATLLRLFGFDHKRLTYRFQGRDFRLTDVAGNVVEKIIA